MIKKYGQFVNDRINEDLNDEFSNREYDENDDNFENDLTQELPEEEDEYNGQILMSELSSKLGVPIETDGSINYKGKKINFYSETENFHIDNKKFKTIDEVISFLELNDDEVTSESKSYKKRKRKS